MLKHNEHALELVDACLHGVLSDADAAIVKKHCEECPICRVAWDEAQKRFEALASLPAVETSSELIERTERRLEKAAARSPRSVPLRWFQRRSVYEQFGLVAATLAVMIGSLHLYYLKLSAAPYDLRVLGQDQLLSGAETSIRVTVFDQASRSLMAGVPVEIELARPATNESVQLASFRTDENGTGSPRFRLPDWQDGSCELRVAARIGRDVEQITHTVTLHRSWRLMVTTDKPVYQPGNPIRIRSLALRRPDLKPVAGGDVAITVADPKGNIIFRRRDVTSRYGIASADCALADEILLGTYRIECRVGDTTSSTSVEVKRYVLPKFKVGIDVDRPYYELGQLISGTVQADYFFGKPVADSAVRVELAAETAGKAGDAAVEQFTVQTGKTGRAEFSFRIPESLARQHDSADAPIVLRATVVDSAGQTESRTLSRVVTASPLRIEVISESGRLVPGVSNVVYLMTTYADGRPAVAHLVVSGFDHEVVTSSAGIATVEFKPQTANDREISWVVRATDRQGLSSVKEIKLPVGRWSDDFLVRTDRAVYTGGQSMHLVAIGRGSEPVFLDLVKDGQTVATDAIAMVNGRGEYTFDLPPDLFGTIELSTYRFRERGRPLQKRRVIYVHQAGSLQIRANLDHKEYRPGQKATIGLQLVDSVGRPTPGAISLTAVDEAVYSVLNQSRGDEQSVFTLNEDLLKPVLALHAWSPSADGLSVEQNQFEQAIFARSAAPSPNDLDSVLDRIDPNSGFVPRDLEILDRPDWEQYLPQGYVSEATMATLRNDGVHTLHVNTYPEKLREAQTRQRKGIGFVTGLWVIFAVVGVGCLIGLCTYALGESVTAAICLPLVLLVFVALMLPAVQAAREASPKMLMKSEAKSVATAVADSRRSMDDTTVLWGGNKNLSYEANAGFVGASNWSLAPPRIREWFPETLLWRPEIITDDQGVARVEVDLADSITTWRLSASAVSAEGQLGASQSAIRVFQPFFVDVNLPVALTRGDEVAVPVVVHNHLDKPQTVTLTVDDAAWFERRGPATQTVALAAGEVKSVAYRLAVRKVGEYRLQVAAQGSGVADAIKRAVTVVADGRRVDHIVNGTLAQPKSIEIERPAEAIEGSGRTILRIYPSSFSQLVEGLDAIFQLPYGCFEQTSSTTYPNLLALDYFRRTKTSAPAVEAKAREYIHLGYQRLLSFEIPGGGFDWFGRPPANRILTAYGLMEFEHMARVVDIDRSVIERTRRWLLDQQAADGSWSPESHGLESDRTRGQGDLARLTSTAYIAWAVFTGGEDRGKAVEAQAFLLAHPPNSIQDPYTLALVCNAILAIDPSGANAAPYLERLEASKEASEGGKRVWWRQSPDGNTMFYGAGQSGNVETTALAALALLSANRSPDAVRGALAWLIEQKGGAGTWGSTQATVLALRALIAGTGQPLGGERIRRIQPTLDGKKLPEIVIEADQSQVMRQIDLSDQLRPGHQTLELADLSGTAAGFQLVSSYYAPDTSSRPQEHGLAVDVTYDRQKLPVNGTLTATATVENKTDRTAPMILVELPIPAGFALDTDSFSKLVEAGSIAKFQAGSQTATVYLRSIDPKGRATLRYRMRATMPVTLTVPPAVAYEYYDSEKCATGRTAQIGVSPESTSEHATAGPG
jgi:alpha-2-macroglobulin-like protein